MIEYRVRLVGDPMGPWTTVSASNPTEAIVIATGCRPCDIGGFSRPRWGTERYGLTRDSATHFLDVEDMRLVPIIRRLVLFAQLPKEDIFKAHAERRAVEELVTATGMFYDDARRTVHMWLNTMDSRHRDTIGDYADY